jgi:clan AA aspartic protease
MGLTHVTMKVGSPTDPARFQTVKFMVDSGAIYSIVPGRILHELGVEPDQIESFSLADSTEIHRETGQASFTYQGLSRVSPVVFGEEGDVTLLGVITLEALGLVLDPIRRELRPAVLRL